MMTVENISQLVVTYCSSLYFTVTVAICHIIMKPCVRAFL